jgi:hypothetical protein
VSTHPEGEKSYIFLADRTQIEGPSIFQTFKAIDELLENGTLIADREGLGF